MKMNEREKKLEKKDSWGYIINIIYKSQPQMHYLMYRRMEKADIHVDLLSNPLIFCADQKNIQTIVLWNY